MEIIQIIILIFVLFALSRVFLRIKDKQITAGEGIFWAGIWLLVGILVFIPVIMSAIANFLGIRRGVDLFVYLAIILLFYLMYRVYVKTETIEQEITKVVREVSLKKSKVKRKKLI